MGHRRQKRHGRGRAVSAAHPDRHHHGIGQWEKFFLIPPWSKAITSTENHRRGR